VAQHVVVMFDWKQLSGADSDAGVEESYQDVEKEGEKFRRTEN
jgi:hypothetical protein